MFGLIAFVLVGLVCLAGLGYILVAGKLYVSDFTEMGTRGGIAIVSIGIVAVCVVLIPIYLVSMRRAVVRLTDSDLTVGSSARVKDTLPIREIQTFEIRQVDKLRTMYVRASGGRWLMINEGMLPNSQAFDRIQQALLSSRPDWRNTGMTWSAR